MVRCAAPTEYISKLSRTKVNVGSISESCKGTITSCKMEACARCQTIPASEDAWTFSLSRHISFMDNTAELHHPCIPSDVVETLLGFKVKVDCLYQPTFMESDPLTCGGDHCSLDN